ncbi:MAG: signal recognition particle protein [Alphaproteobacteria bacterium]|nr:signal recognition particle protein [Alphaproteobacteria bacterium]
MFDHLSSRLAPIFDRLKKRAVLVEKDVNEALIEIRRALLEADVALEVVQSFIDRIRHKAIGHEIIKSVTPVQQVIKLVHDELVHLLGEDAGGINLEAESPIAVMLVGLQGSGKTTTAAKLGLRLSTQDKQKILLASLDVYRPAAQEQLRVLGCEAGIETLPIVEGQLPAQIAMRAMQAAKLSGVDVVILDTAGRVHIDEPLMVEMSSVKALVNPHEILLVADALTGQDAVNIARGFDSCLGLTGVVLTRLDGDGRGGAALSMRAVTGRPIKYAGVGEKLDCLDLFRPGRVADQILGMGDIIGLVEKASQAFDAGTSEQLARKMEKGNFDLTDLSGQLEQMTKMGGIAGMLGMLPGIGKIKDQLLSSRMDDQSIKRQIAIISSMTPLERRKPDVLKASRKKRIAAGAGVRVEDVNKLLKMYYQAVDMMKAFGKGKRGKKKGTTSGLFGGGLPQIPPGLSGLSGSGGGLTDFFRSLKKKD